MVLGTHLLVAEYVHEYILEETGFELSLRWFRYGNVKPDLRRSYFGVGHYYKESIDLVEAMYEHVMDQAMGLAALSEVLGSICHFITDYFCVYHNTVEKSEEALIKHMAYELALHPYVKQAIEDKTFKLFDLHQGSLRDKIQRILKHYDQEPVAPITDASYALSATGMLMKQVVGDYINRYVAVDFVNDHELVKDNVA